MNLSKQFINKVKWEVDRLTGCWNIKTGKDNGEGYFYISYQIDRNTKGVRGSIKGKRMGAHRMAYIVFNGRIPNGKCVRHTCDNRSCVNPEHLIIGTKKDNSSDMVARGRSYKRKERGGARQKLTSQQIVEIKKSPISSYQLAKIYPVSSTHIRRIKNGSRCLSVNL